MTHTDAAPHTPDPAQHPTRPEPAALPTANRHHHHDSLVLIALLVTCAATYLAVGESGFTGIISAVAALYGICRTRR
ncbi:hypothetical protein [Streptomyces sp. NPDC002990]